MNKHEFERTVLPVSEKLFRFARRFVGDTELAKDCVQETIMKLWEKRSTLEALDSIPGYALTMVRNICIDKLRRAGRTAPAPAQAISPGVEWTFELQEGKLLITRLVQLLPAQQRMIMELRDLEDFTNEEVAEALNISVNNVRVNLSHARKKIRAELTKLYNHGLERH